MLSTIVPLCLLLALVASQGFQDHEELRQFFGFEIADNQMVQLAPPTPRTRPLSTEQNRGHAMPPVIGTSLTCFCRYPFKTAPLTYTPQLFQFNNRHGKRVLGISRRKPEVELRDRL
ncbi:unnamed protein product, partial [Mesorhabditis spiculigera]